MINKEQEQFEYLTWLEQQGIGNAQLTIQCYTRLRDAADKLLLVIMAAIGGSGGFVWANFCWEPLTVSASVFNLFFIILGVLLNIFCLKTSEIKSPHKEPSKLIKNDESFKNIRFGYILKLEEETKSNDAECMRFAKWLDRIRYAIVLSPLVFIVTYVICFYFL